MTRMSYKRRILALMLIDSVIVLLTIYFCNFLLFPVATKVTKILIVSSITLLIGHHVFGSMFGLYKRVWKYASVGELISIARAVSLSILLTAVVQQVVNHDVYFRMLFITWMMHILLIGGVRFSYRLLRDDYQKQQDNKKRTLIIGAGAAGAMVVRQLKHNVKVDLCPVAFIDDDATKHNLEIMGLPVVGCRDRIEQVVEQYKIQNILIAIPSLKKKDLNDIVSRCNRTSAKVQIIPTLEDIMLGKLSVDDARDVQVEDLLGRDAVELDTESIRDCLTGSVVLVTGAGGSIGSEICRQASLYQPSKIILLGHGENSIYTINMELQKSNGHNIEYITEIADIQDRDRMFAVLKKHKPKVVFHAAAHKHVPLMEENPQEAVKNNILGTKNVAEAADAAGVETFVMISTDKAVNPTSVMGASKRIAEMIIQDLDKRSRTRFVAVRFGNVLGSRGSVIPLFKEQIKNGGPVTVTHPDMVRYFMTIPEASSLVLQAAALARGGEIFVLDMGEPVKIVDLARNLIRLSGYTEEEIPITFTGIRPGEKLFEELLNENEVYPEQLYPKIYVGKAVEMDAKEVLRRIENFSTIEAAHLKEILLEIANHRLTPALRAVK